VTVIRQKNSNKTASITNGT